MTGRPTPRLVAYESVDRTRVVGPATDEEIRRLVATGHRVVVRRVRGHGRTGSM